MRPPQPEGAPRLDVSIEELEAWLERARPALGAEGYEKLRAAIRTLGYVTELLEKKETTPGGAARVVVSCQHGENRPGAGAGGHRDGGEEAGPRTRLAEAGPRTRLAEAEARGGRARAPWRGRVWRGAEGQSSARVVKGGRCVSGYCLRR